MLEQLGVDAGELAEVDIDDPHPCPEDGPECEEHEFEDGVCLACGLDGEDVDGNPYDFSTYPPNFEAEAAAPTEAVFLAVQGAVMGRIKGMEAEGGRALYVSREGRTALQIAGQTALDAAWPGRYSVFVGFVREQMEIGIKQLIDPEQHADAWGRFMLEHDPRGYAITETPQGWKWRARARPGVAEVEMSIPERSTAQITAEQIQTALAQQGHTGIKILPCKPDQAAARTSAWAHYLEVDAHTLADLLAMVGLWPETYDPETSTYKALDGAEVDHHRVTWVQGWTLLELGQATAWAVATHLQASDNDKIRIPPRPACLDRERPR